MSLYIISYILFALGLCFLIVSIIFIIKSYYDLSELLLSLGLVCLVVAGCAFSCAESISNIKEFLLTKYSVATIDQIK